ncbi:hypothetical protein [Acetobacter okinawensis]|nr:hypothetical protein [Acetobacter okinawensis]
MTRKPEDLQTRLLQALGAVSALLEQENALLTSASGRMWKNCCRASVS